MPATTAAATYRIPSLLSWRPGRVLVSTGATRLPDRWSRSTLHLQRGPQQGAHARAGDVPTESNCLQTLCALRERRNLHPGVERSLAAGERSERVHRVVG